MSDHHSRYFPNKNTDLMSSQFEVDKKFVENLATKYVQRIIKKTTPGSHDDRRGDLYVGDAGIAYMFLQLYHHESFNQSQAAHLEKAKLYIQSAKNNAKHYSKRADERCAFLCGNAGIYAVAAAISEATGNMKELKNDLENFSTGFAACKPLNFNRDYGSDEVLVGRAGFLSGAYWLNKTLTSPPFEKQQILDICELMYESGSIYSQQTRSSLPLMYQYHGSEYLGAAHGVCAIYLMMLQSAWFEKQPGSTEFTNISVEKLSDVKKSIDGLMALQDSEGNFPVVLNDLREKRLVHWCHGAPGTVYLFAKAFLVFGEEKYLEVCKLASDAVWKKGLLKKGPGICHGVAGNGYVFLLLYRLTHDKKYLYRAQKFAEFLTDEQFINEARTPDRPYSLYEGIAGAVCFLLDLLNPEQAAFPFMDVF